MFYENAMLACERRNTQLTTVLKDLTISTGNLSSWKKGGTPSAEICYKIAQRLGVSMEFLVSGVESMQTFTQDELGLVRMYRKLPSSKQEFISDSVQAAYDREVSFKASSSQKLSG